MPSPRKASYVPPTDEEILSYDNVPVDVAARYLKQSSSTIYYALQDHIAPYGYATECEHSFVYNISPGLLVAYKRGTLPLFPAKQFFDYLSELTRSDVCAKNST